MAHRSVKVLELYAGIGGVAAAGADVVAAIDHDPYAHAVYTQSFDHPAHRLNLVSVKASRLEAFGADLWWMSPPCQPYTIRGARRDLDDRRAESFVHLLEVLETVRPTALIVENVPGFEGSLAHARLRHTLRDYALAELEWCPTQFGHPVQRRRFFLVATQHPVDTTLPAVPRRPLTTFLDPVPPAHTRLDDAFLARFGGALHVVDPTHPNAEAVCFTGAYGRSPVYAGSYLLEDGRPRRFSPAEIARLHGFDERLRLPDDPRRSYKLLGNSLAVPVVRALLRLTGAL